MIARQRVPPPRCGRDDRGENMLAKFNSIGRDARRVFAPRFLTSKLLQQQNRLFKGSGGVSRNNRAAGFRPGFIDTDSGEVYLSRFADGRPAPMHVLDGLPEELVTARDESGCVQTVKATVTAGFVRNERFFTRSEAAAATEALEASQEILKSQLDVHLDIS